jgi:glyoxylase-like metal-dependent hydrolase (beta-lactamase superfamily II)
MGDLFFNGRYPFVDLSSGGSFEGVISAVDAAMAYVNDSTKVIPGHGPLAGKKELVAYRGVLVTIRDRVAALIKMGKTKEEVIAAKISAEWDASWGTGFIKPEAFLGVVYDSMKKQ